MKTMDKNMKWIKLNTSILNFSLNLRGPFCTSTFTSYIIIALLDVHTREKQCLSLAYIMYDNASNHTLSCTHVSLYVVWRVHP